MAVRIDYKACKGCKSCYNHCPGDILGWDDEKSIPYIAYPRECWHCGICQMECKENAICHTFPPQCLSEVNKRFLAVPAGTILSREKVGGI
jgi:NAD-dependent dihydropyrimidine dehydrogenase PreA subunit